MSEELLRKIRKRAYKKGLLDGLRRLQDDHIWLCRLTGEADMKYLIAQVEREGKLPKGEA